MNDGFNYCCATGTRYPGTDVYHALNETGDGPVCGTPIEESNFAIIDLPPQYGRKCKRCFRDLWEHLK